MKFTSSFLVAFGAGAASAFPNVANLLPRDDWANQHPWKAPGKGDVRAPCPGLNTLANHGFLPHDGKNITVDMAVKAFGDGFNMGSDIITSAAGSAMSVCQQVEGKPCKAFNLDHLNTPHTFEHDASFTREDYNFGKGNNHDFNQKIFDTVLELWKDTDIIDYSYANAARLMRIDACKKADEKGWFTQNDGTQLTEMAFYMGTMGTPEHGNARKDWIIYWWTHERFPFELGWNPKQRSVHNQATINTMINNMLNAPPPKGKGDKGDKNTSSTGKSTGSSKPTSIAGGYGQPAVSTTAKSSSTTKKEGYAPSSTAKSSSTKKDDCSTSTSKHTTSTPAGYGTPTHTTTTTSHHTTSSPAPYGVPGHNTTTTSHNTTTSCKESSKTVPAPTGPYGVPAHNTTTSCKESSKTTSTSTPAGYGVPAHTTTTAAHNTTTSCKESSHTANAPTPGGYGTFPVHNATTTPAAHTTTYMSTSTVCVTTEITVTSCHPTVTNCPAHSMTPMVVTKTISQYTTVCPVTATIVPTGTAPTIVTSAAPSSTSAWSYPEQTCSYNFVSGAVVPVVSGTPAPTPAATSAGPNPYFQSVPASAFPTVPASIVSAYSANEGVYAPPSYAPAYTQSGAPSYGSVQATPTSSYVASTGGLSYPTDTSAPIATAAAVAGKGVSGAVAGLAVAAFLL